jgi:PTH2 family peptidyl-tRNA hydrolase
MPETKQVIIIRTKFPDGKGGHFGMRTGKIAAQAAHASMKVFLDRGSVQTLVVLEDDGGTTHEETTLGIPITETMASWIRGIFTKVVVGVETEEDLLRCHELAKERGLPTALITDVGTTEFKGVPTHTAVAIGPDEVSRIDEITGPTGIVRVKLL